MQSEPIKLRIVYTYPSPFTCARCGKPALWVYFGEVTPPASPDGNAEDGWWLDIPCRECGSPLFDVRVDNPRSHMQLFGVNV